MSNCPHRTPAHLLTVSQSCYRAHIDACPALSAFLLIDHGRHLIHLCVLMLMELYHCAKSTRFGKYYDRCPASKKKGQKSSTYGLKVYPKRGYSNGYAKYAEADV